MKNLYVCMASKTFILYVLLHYSSHMSPPPDSSYWSHAGLHSTGWEESGFAAQLPPRFPQVRFDSHHTTRDSMSCLADSQMSSYIYIHISAAWFVANPQNMSPEINFPLETQQHFVTNRSNVWVLSLMIYLWCLTLFW